MNNIFEIYTDGSCDNINEPNHGGYAYIILQNGGVVKEFSGSTSNTTNNRMELCGIINSIDDIPSDSVITIYTDSQYCVTVLNHTIKTYPKNMDLIKEFRSKINDKNIDYTFKWVRGHNGNKWNEAVDKLANGAYTALCNKDIDSLPSGLPKGAFYCVVSDPICKHCEVERGMVKKISPINDSFSMTFENGKWFLNSEIKAKYIKQNEIEIKVNSSINKLEINNCPICGKNLK